MIAIEFEVRWLIWLLPSAVAMLNDGLLVPYGYWATCSMELPAPSLNDFEARTSINCQVPYWDKWSSPVLEPLNNLIRLA